MKIIPPSYEMDKFDGVEMMKRIEKAGKTCYKSEETITEKSYDGFIRMIIRRGHESVLEHEKITFRVICDRGVTHEIVRHRIASYSQESTRFCNYGNKEIEYIDITPFLKEEWVNEKGVSALRLWHEAMEIAEDYYKEMIRIGVPPELARSVLPNSLKTEIVITMNLRELRHFFKLRTAKTAHPQMREIMKPIFKEIKEKMPAVFYDIELGDE